MGPIAARYAIVHGDAWRWLFYAPAICCFISFFLLYFLYYPPKHPRGLDFHTALKELDYVGGILFILSATLILVGIVYTVILKSSDPKVIGLLVSGFAALIGFVLYEHFADIKQPLTPTHSRFLPAILGENPLKPPSFHQRQRKRVHSTVYSGICRHDVLLYGQYRLPHSNWSVFHRSIDSVGHNTNLQFAVQSRPRFRRNLAPPIRNKDRPLEMDLNRLCFHDGLLWGSFRTGNS